MITQSAGRDRMTRLTHTYLEGYMYRTKERTGAEYLFITLFSATQPQNRREFPDIADLQQSIPLTSLKQAPDHHLNYSALVIVSDDCDRP